MKLRNLTYIFIALSATLFMGCEKGLDDKAAATAAGEGKASLSLTIETKRPTPMDGRAADGSAINDAYVFVVKDDGSVIDGIAVISANEDTEKEVVIKNLDFGPHKIYVYANTRGFDNIYPAFNSTIKNLQKGNTFSYAEATFQNLTGGALPQISYDEMPLTGIIKDVNLGSGNNSAEIELVRPFAKLSIYVYNEAKYRLDVSDLTFNAFSPNTAYLFDHFPYVSNYTPTLEYQTPLATGTAQVVSGKETPIYEGLFYEGRLLADKNDTYRASMKLKFWDAAGTGRYMTFKEFTETQITSETAVGGTSRTIKFGDRYIICVNGNLMLSEHGPDMYNIPSSFLWDFIPAATSGHFYIKSVASDKYLWCTETRIGADLETSSNVTELRRAFQFSASGNNFYIRHRRSDSIFNTSYYYVNIKAGNLAVAPNTTGTPAWTVSGVTSAEVDECNVTDLVMRQINEDGSSSNMSRMLRNNHFVIKLFVNYTDDPVSEFIYYVNPWVSTTNDIVFN